MNPQTPRNEISQTNHWNGLNGADPAPDLQQKGRNVCFGLVLLLSLLPASHEPDYPLKGLLEVQITSWQWHRQKTDLGIEHLSISRLEQRETTRVRSGTKHFFKQTLLGAVRIP